MHRTMLFLCPHNAATSPVNIWHGPVMSSTPMWSGSSRNSNRVQAHDGRCGVLRNRLMSLPGVKAAL
jgi:hypothetical protein